MPAQFNTPNTSQASFYNLSEDGLIKISGPNAKTFLQGQLTCDLEKITENTGTLAAHCHPQGRILSLFYLFLFQDAYYLLTPIQLVQHTLDHLKKYAIFYKVELSDVSHAFKLLAHTSPTTLFPQIEFTTTRSYLSLANPADVVATETAEDWHRLNLNKGIARLYTQTVNQFLAHELNLPNLGAVSFDKGCYTGQEIIARMHYRGKLKKHLQLAHFHFNGALKAGDELQDNIDKIVATIVDLVRLNAQEYEMLILIDDHATKDQTLLYQQQSGSLTLLNTYESSHV